jgi:dipeptidyl aminopeptidase/acylaminoacyl peptidase
LPPGQEDLFPGLHYRPGIYADVNPRWSHDGKRIAFLRTTTDRHLQLYVADEDLERPLAQLEKELLCPDRPYDSDLRRYASPDTLTWSPNDREIAFERIEWFTFEDGQRLPGTGIWSLNTYSGRVTPLALHPAHYLNLLYYYHTPQWSPDGRYLAFVGEGINGQRTIFVRPIAAMPARKVVPRFDTYEDSDWPVWRPGATRRTMGLRQPVLAFRQGIRHPLAGSDTETLRRLMPGAATGASDELWRIRNRDYARSLFPHTPDISVTPRAAHLTWSPDGQRLAYTLTPDANAYDRYEIWVTNADGSRPHRISARNGRGYLAPVWLDASHIGALSPRNRRYDVLMIDLVSGTTVRLGTIPSADCDWSPDRTRIVYSLPQGSQQAGNTPTSLRLFATGIGRRHYESTARR